MRHFKLEQEHMANVEFCCGFGCEAPPNIQTPFSLSADDFRRWRWDTGKRTGSWNHCEGKFPACRHGAASPSLSFSHQPSAASTPQSPPSHTPNPGCSSQSAGSGACDVTVQSNFVRANQGMLLSPKRESLLGSRERGRWKQELETFLSRWSKADCVSSNKSSSIIQTHPACHMKSLYVLHKCHYSFLFPDLTISSERLDPWQTTDDIWNTITDY